jgi:CBS domain containing-hemolysin-like protein
VDDEWGTVEGIATVEDVLEVVVGDIRDEFDDGTDEPGIATDETASPED